MPAQAGIHYGVAAVAGTFSEMIWLGKIVLLEDSSLSDEKVQALKILSRFGLGLGALGGLLSVFGIYFLFIANESLSWSSVEGAVVEAEVRTDVSLRTNPSGATPNPSVEYYVSVNYTYDVEGNPYFSSRYSLGQGDRASRTYKERADATAEAASWWLVPVAGDIYPAADPHPVVALHMV
jgi:hypothetical protein